MNLLSFDAAVAAGAAHYWTGKPCKRGHVVARNVAGRTCSECVKLHAAAWYARNTEKAKANSRASKAARPDKVREQRRQHRERHKLPVNLRCRLRDHLKRNGIDAPADAAVSFLGCDIATLKTYLESKFQDGMSWDNWTLTGWHIDHIVALADFDLTNPEQLAAACHYTNLQPLWAGDNARKGWREWRERNGRPQPDDCRGDRR